MRTLLALSLFYSLLFLNLQPSLAEEADIKKFLAPEANPLDIQKTLQGAFRMTTKYCNRSALTVEENLKEVVLSQVPAAFEKDIQTIDEKLLPMMGIEPQKKMAMNKCEEKERQLEQKLGLHEPITKESLRKRRVQIAQIENPKAKMQEYFRYFSHLIAYRAFPCSANPIANLQKYLKSVKLNMKLSDDAEAASENSSNPFIVPNPTSKTTAIDTAKKSIQTQERLAGSTKSLRFTVVADTSPVMDGSSIQISHQQGLINEAGANATAISAVKSFNKGAGTISAGTARVKNLQMENSKPQVSSFVNIGYLF